jgi:hypothetical protein
MNTRQHPFPGNRLLHVNNMSTEEATLPNEQRIPTTDLDYANVCTSGYDHPVGNGPDDNLWHRPVLDMDFPVQVHSSSTPGHCHVYIDKVLPWEAYVRLLEVMAEVGLLEPGYVRASVERGHTAARLPWVNKHDPASRLRPYTAWPAAGEVTSITNWGQLDPWSAVTA